MPIRIPVVQTGLEASIQAAAKKAGKAMKIDMGAGAKSIEGLSQPLGRITGKADQFTKSMEAANARVLAFGASVGVLSAVTRGFEELVKTTIEVEKSLTSINAILGTTSGQLNKFKKTIFDVARNTEQSFGTVANAALELSRQGLKAEEVTKRLNDAMMLSRLSGQGAAEAVAGLTAAINSFKKAGISSAEVVNKFSDAAKNAAVSERDLAEAIKRAGSVANIAGVSFDELVGIVSAVQQKTSRGGAVIGNSFKTIFTRIQSLDKLKTMQNLGVQVTDASGEILGATKLIQNLAATLEQLPDAQRLQIAENLVGKFQVAPFVAILEDYNDKASIAIRLTEISQNASTAAYERNDALNKTLSASINKTVVSVKELANELGNIGVTDNLKGILDFFSNLVGNIQNLLEGDSIGSKFAKGIVKGIGGVLSGPGLAIFGAILAKLTIDLARFGLGSLKTFFGLNKAAKEQVLLQGQIASTLLGNKGIQAQIMAIENSTLSIEQKRMTQTRFFTTALNEQMAIMTRMQSIAARVAPGVMAGTQRRGRGAGGYIPNFNATAGYGSEQGDINRGVGGAPKNARPVTMPNFNFGGGQRGTMVANTSEYVVPNFGGGGGSAIFNQNMVSSMGLPAGARKIGAARGYIPNFAINDREGYVMLTGQKGGRQKDETVYTGFKKGKKKRQYSMQDFKGARSIHVPIYNLPNKLKKGALHIDDFITKLKTQAADQAVIQAHAISGDQMPDPANMELIKKKINKGSLNSYAGTIYELTLAAMLSDKEFKAYADTTDTSNFDLDLQGAGGKRLQKLYKMKGSPKFGEVKGLVSGDNIKSAAAKIFRVLNPDGTKQAPQVQKFLNRAYTRKAAAQVGHSRVTTEDLQTYGDRLRPATNRAKVELRPESSASGYIPSFATSPLDAAVNREVAAGVPLSQVRVNQSGKLRNAANPQGLAVTNMRDEPTGAIPNFAKKTPPLGLADIGTASKPVERSLAALNQKLNELNKGLLKGKVSFDQAEKEVDQFSKSIKTNVQTQKKVATAAKGRLEQEKQTTKQSRDYLGTIFAVQAGLSALSGATSDAEGGIGRWTNRLSEGLGGLTTAAFAGSALKSFGDSLQESRGKVSQSFGKLVGGLGTLTVAVGGALAVFKMLNQMEEDRVGITDSNSLALARMTDAANAAAGALRKVSEEEEVDIKMDVTEALGKARGQAASAGAAFLGGLNPWLDVTQKGLIGQDPEMLTGGQVQMTATQQGVLEKQLLQTLGEAAPEDRNKALNDAMRMIQEEAGIKRNKRGEIVGGDVDVTTTWLGRESNMGEVHAAFTSLKEFARIMDNLRGQFLTTNEDRAKAEKAEREKTTTTKAKTEAINQMDLDMAKELIKFEVMKRKAFLSQNLALKKRISQAKILGNMSKEDLRTLEETLRTREGEGKLASLRLDIFDKAAASLKGIIADENQIAEIREAIGKLSAKDAGEREKVVPIIKNILGITTKLPPAVAKMVEKFLLTNDAAAHLLKLGIDNELWLKRAADHANNIKDALDAAAKIRLQGAAESAFKVTFGIDQAINKKRLQKENLTQGLTLAGGPQEEARIRNRLEALDTEIARLNRTKVDASLLEGLQKTPLPTSAVSVEVTKEFNDLLSKAKTPEKAIGVLEEFFDMGVEMKLLNKDQLIILRGQIDAAKRKMKQDREAGDQAVKLAQKQEDAAEALEIAIQGFVNQATQAGLMGLTSGARAAQRRAKAVAERPDLTPANAAALSDMQRSVGRRLFEHEDFDPVKQADRLADTITTASINFKNTMADAMVDTIVQGGNLGDVLRSAATDFFTMISKAYMKSAVDKLVGSALPNPTGGGGGLFSGILSFLTGKNSGGLITGGSGNRDDVPTLLTGGEFVIRKGAVEKYGAGFFEGLNTGRVGQMQRGGLYTPGTYGQGAMTGQRSLLDFATQSFTGGQFDQVGGGAGFGSASLEPMSARLTMFGRRNSPLFQREQDSQREAFGLYVRQSQHEEEIRKQEEERKKQFRNSMIMAAASVAFNQFTTGFSESMKASKGGEQGPLSRIFSATGAGITGFESGGQRYGGLLNFGGHEGLLPSQIRAQRTAAASVGSGSGGVSGRGIQAGGLVSTAFGPRDVDPQTAREIASGRFAEVGGNEYVGSSGMRYRDVSHGLPTVAVHPSHFPAGTILNVVSDLYPEGTHVQVAGTGPARGRLDFYSTTHEQMARFAGQRIISVQPVNNAAGGYVSPSAGVDTVPSMLSGGEFVMNAAATQRMGRGNLAALNSGGGGDGGDDAIVAAINNLGDELEGGGETVINITVNSDGTETQDNNGDEQQQNLALKIKDVVRQVIDEEQRLGGSLRRV